MTGPPLFLSVPLLFLSTGQIRAALSTSLIATAGKKVKIYIKYSYLLTHTDTRPHFATRQIFPIIVHFFFPSFLSQLYYF